MPFNAEFFDGRDTERLHAVQRLRKAIFIDGRGWRLRTADDREVGESDTEDIVHRVLSLDGAPCATLRAIRTDRPYLSQVVFPQFAVMSPDPRRRDALSALTHLLNSVETSYATALLGPARLSA